MKRFLAILLAAMLVTGGFTGCGKKETPSNIQNVNSADVSSTNASSANAATGSEDSEAPGYMNATGYPIAKDNITLKLMGAKNPIHSEWKDMEVMKRMEKITNISFNYDTPLLQGYTERKNLAFASGELPDVFYCGAITPTDEETYGSQGMLLQLDKYIDKYAPNLKKRLDSDPNLKNAITATDGHIYSLPCVVRTKTNASSLIYINTDWLNAVGMTMPETADDFYKVLKAFKEKDPNKNQKQDEIPLSYWKQISSSGYIPSTLNSVLLAAFSGQAAGANIDIRDGKVVFNPMEPYFKDYLAYMRKLYAENLLDPEIFTQTLQQYIAKYQSGVMGLSTISLSSVLKPGEKAPYEILAPLTSEKNSKKATVELPGITTGGFALTNKCKYPEAMMRWADIFYADVENNAEGICGLSNFLGIYKYNWDFTDDSKTKYTRESKVEGVTPVDYINKYVMPGSFGWVVTDAIPDTDPLLLLKANECEKNYFPYTVPSYPASVRFNKQDTERLSFLSNDITTYVDQMIAKFIIGEESLDNWDAYVSKLKQMNIDELIEIRQNAYDKWNKGN